MKISIFGLGYVGCVELGCLAQNGHQVIGVDINQAKVDLINKKEPTILEEGILELIRENVENGRISATGDSIKAVRDTDISFICVGTSATDIGGLNLESVFNAARKIGRSLTGKSSFHTVVIRSTVLPGTNQKVGTIIEEESGKKRNREFGIVSNPEFLREGSSVEDYHNPPFTIIGTDSDKAGEIMKELYKNTAGKIITAETKLVEMIKLVNNSFHALKITFANEVGNICKKAGINSHALMELFCKDTKLNISPYYFKPGFAYGGSCLPKDLQTLKTLAHDFYLDTPVIEHIARSNEFQKKTALNMILAEGKKKIGILGLSFKKGTDDLRNSPAVELAEQLLGKGLQVSIYDENVVLSNLMGKNKEQIESKIPHIKNLITADLEKVIEQSDVLIITQPKAKFKPLIKQHPDKIFIDLVKIADKTDFPNYRGICW